MRANSITISNSEEGFGISSKPLMPVIVRSESNLHCCTAASIRFVWPMRKDDTHTSRRVTNCIASARHATATIRWTATSYTANTNCTIALLLQSACFVRMYDKRIARHCRLRADLYSQPLIITTIADAEDVDGIAVIVSVLRQCRILNMIFSFLTLRL